MTTQKKFLVRIRKRSVIKRDADTTDENFFFFSSLPHTRFSRPAIRPIPCPRYGIRIFFPLNFSRRRSTIQDGGRISRCKYSSLTLLFLLFSSVAFSFVIYQSEQEKKVQNDFTFLNSSFPHFFLFFSIFHVH